MSAADTPAVSPDADGATSVPFPPTEVQAAALVLRPVVLTALGGLPLAALLGCEAARGSAAEALPLDVAPAVPPAVPLEALVTRRTARPAAMLSAFDGLLRMASVAGDVTSLTAAAARCRAVAADSTPGGRVRARPG